MSKLEVDAIEPQSGTTLTLGASGDTVNLGSGATLGSGMGKVLQVVFFELGTEVSTTSNFGSTGNATGVKASITPSSTSSKIFITTSINDNNLGDGTNTNKIGLFGLKHNTSGNLLIRHRVGASLSATTSDIFDSITFNYLHSPSSTSSQEYEVTFGRFSGTYNNTVRINDGGTQQSNITLMEIAG
jgi:hypothetical protein